MAELLATRQLRKNQRPSDWIGHRQGHLTIIAFEGYQRYRKGGVGHFRFKCDCGHEFVSQKSNIINRRFDCGCSKRRVTYPPGFTKHPLAGIWQGIHNRCSNPNTKSFRDYGARGISVCERWTTGEDALTGFECFVADMGARPDGYTIERDDADGPYSPSNCRWISKGDQSKNRRGVLLLTISGETKTIPDWCAIYGIKYFTARRRIERGWDAVAAVTTPPTR